MNKRMCKTFLYTRYDDKGGTEERMAFGIGVLPDRKQLALYLTRYEGLGQVRIRPVAYFKESADAELFQEIFYNWVINRSAVQGG